MSYAVLWSPSQQCFHIEPLDVMLKTNMHHCATGARVDYITIDIKASSEDAHAEVDKLKKLKRIGE